MSPAYISGMAKHLPGAKVAFDKFHVVQLANRAMEAVRRLERQDGVEDLKRGGFGSWTATICLRSRSRWRWRWSGSV